MENPEQQLGKGGETPAAGGPDAPSGWRLIFLRAGGLRAGWRLILFAVFFAVAFGLLMPAAVALRLPLPTSNRVITPATVITQELLFISATFIAVLLMAWIEGRSFSDYGLPLRGAFGGRFWKGSVWGIVAFSATILLDRGAARFFAGPPRALRRALIRQSLVWAVAFAWWESGKKLFFEDTSLFTLADGIGFWPAASVLSALFGHVHLIGNAEESLGGYAADFPDLDAVLPDVAADGKSLVRRGHARGVGLR